MKNISTTLEFITNHIRATGFVINDIVLTQGYTVQGDKGGARWKATGNVIALSQTVIDTNDIRISDASGNEFELVAEGIIDLQSLGDVTEAFEIIAITAGLEYSLALGPVRFNDQVGTTYTTILTDGANKTVTLNNVAAIALTIPPNSSVAYAIGTLIAFNQLNTGQVTMTPGAGVTLNSEVGTLITAQYGFVSALKTATDTWLLAGSLSA